MLRLVNMFIKDNLNNNENLYKILNVSINASDTEIKQAFRKLSLLYHPDKQSNCNSEIYRNILSAYEILGDNLKKSLYDQQLNNQQLNNQQLNNPELNNHQFNNQSLNNQQLNNQQLNNQQLNNQQLNNQQLNNESIIEFDKNNINMSEISEIIFKELEISLEESYKGCIIPLEIERWIKHKNNKIKEIEKIYITIPKGIDNNEIILIKNKGNSINNILYGDVKIQIKIKKNNEYYRKGLDIIYYKNITLKESLCGFKFNLKLLNEKVYTINNEGDNIIKDNQEKIIPNLGMERDNYKGNLIIIFKILYPDQLTYEQREKLNKIL